MRKLVVFLFWLAVLGGAGIWFWSLGSLPDEVAPQVRVLISHDPVEVQSAGSSSWSAAHDGQELMAGESIRTGSGGSAMIVSDERAETRLGPNTEIAIERADMGIQTPLAVKLRLASGRVWNRVLRLLDLDESYVLRTDTIVATVRGTSFDLQTSATGTTLWVSDSAVEVTGGELGSSAPSPDASFVVTEGSMAKFDTQGKVLTSQPITDDARQSDWFVKNTASDDQFQRDVTNALASKLSALGAEQPQSLMDSLTKLSERIHLSLNASAAPRSFARYTERRLFAIDRAIEDGNSGLAFQALSMVQDDVTARITGPNGDVYRQALKVSLGEVLYLLKDVGSSSSAYRLKQQIEDLNVRLAGSDPVATAYAHLVSIEARLDEASSLITLSSLDDAKNALDAARDGLQNVERDMDQLPSNVSTDDVNALRSKLNTLKFRESEMRIRLATALAPPTGQITSPDTTSPTSTTPTETASSTASTSPTTVTSTAVGFQRLELTVQPDPAMVGDTVQLSVKGILPDGTSEDVTARSQFRLSGTIGSLNGPVYSSSQPGSVTITASYTDGTQLLRASRSLQIQAVPITLKSLQIVPQGSTSLTFQSRVALNVTATYSDGSSKDVTSFAQLTSSNPSIGSMVGNVFVAGRVAGTATVTATYSDASGAATGSLDVAVRAN